MKRSGDSTHPCWSSTPVVNGHDLTLLTQTQTSEQEYTDLMASNKRPSTLHSRKTQSFSQGTWSYALWGSQNMCEDIFNILPRFLKNLLESEMWSVVLQPGRKPHCVSFSFESDKLRAAQWADHQWNTEWADNPTTVWTLIPDTSTHTFGMTLPRSP